MEIKVVVLIFCVVIPNLTMSQMKHPFRRSIGTINAPPNSLLSQSYQNGIGLQNMENRFEDLLPKSQKIKSPSYQHKLLQLHGDPNTESVNVYNPTKLFRTHYLLSRLMPSYPVAGKVGKVENQKSGSPNSLENEETDFWTIIGAEMKPQLVSNTDEPNFNPYVGADSLTNMTRFFEHVLQNLRAVQSKQDKDDAEKLTG